MKGSEYMKEKLANLLSVKSIVTILLTLVVCYLAIAKDFDIKEIYLMIIAFYFGTQFQKKENQVNNEIKEEIK